MKLDEAIRRCLEQARKLQDKADRVGDRVILLRKEKCYEDNKSSL